MVCACVVSEDWDWARVAELEGVFDHTPSIVVPPTRLNCAKVGVPARP
jgi:hypothetical protein